jgi:hypothetical protein
LIERIFKPCPNYGLEKFINFVTTYEKWSQEKDEWLTKCKVFSKIVLKFIVSLHCLKFQNHDPSLDGLNFILKKYGNVWGIVVKLEIIVDGVNSLTTLAEFLMVVHFPKYGSSNASFPLDVFTHALELF